MRESDKLGNGKNYINAALMAIPVILRLLYSTGMRVSEATTLKNEDVFLDRHYIHLRKTKNGHERLVPLGDDMIVELRQYGTFRNRIPVNKITGSGNSYFIKMDGLPVRSYSVRLYFRAILDKLRYKVCRRQKIRAYMICGILSQYTPCCKWFIKAWISTHVFPYVCRIRASYVKGRRKNM